jgi:methionyl-tRNA formyltransferase
LNNIVFFVNDNVGLECISFVILEHFNDIKYIVVTDKTSIVYKYLIYSKFTVDKILFNQEILNHDFSSIDYIFLLWWPYIIGQEIISLANKGVINTHPSLLPYNRGKNYNFWNLVEDVPFGVSLHFVNGGVDSGDIIFQQSIKKTWECTGGTLYKKAKLEMINLFKSSYVKIINDNYQRKKQDLTKGSYHNSIELYKASEIFLEKNYKAKELLNLLRARTFSGYEGCYFYDENNDKYEIQIQIKRIKK